MRALVINQRTNSEAAMKKESLWTVARSGIDMILLSPEQLATKGFENLINDSELSCRICGFLVDEMHLINTWGKGFRKKFTQIGFARSRLTD